MERKCAQMGTLLEGKVAVVTGSGQGVGRAVALELARQGARVVTNNRKPGANRDGAGMITAEMRTHMQEGDRQWLEARYADHGGDAETTAAAIRAEGGQAVSFFGDISDFDTAGQLIQTAVDTFGSVDILANIAGGFGFSPIESLPPDLWERVTAVKPKGYYNTIRHAVPHMLEKGWGRIINCTSRAFLGDVIKHAEYCAANAGVVGLTRAVAIELWGRGVTCNAFSPFARTRASVDLEMYGKASGGQTPWTDPKFSVSYEGTPMPEQVAPFICYLATPAAEKISGTVFELAGNKIGRYSEPEVVRSVVKEGEPWSVEELVEKAPRLLFQGYRSIADK